MAMNSETPKQGGSGRGDLEKRVANAETRLTVIEKTMITAEVFQRELAAFRDEMRLGFGSLREEIGRLRDEMHVGFGEVRKEMHVGLADVRKEMQVMDGALRVEIGNLRDQMHVGFGEVRKEMQAMDGALRVEIAKTHVEIAKTPFETFKWLLAAAGLAAAMATAIYNIWFR